MKSARLLIPVLALPTLILVALVVFRIHTPRKEWVADGREKPNDGVYKKWAEDKFIPVTQTESFRELIYNIPISSSAGIDKNQATALHDEVYNLLMAFSEPNYKYFEAFRFPITNGLFDNDILSYRLDYLNSHELQNEKLTLKEPYLICEKWWDSICANSLRFATNDVVYATNTYYGSGFLKEVSLATALLTVDDMKVLAPPLNRFVTSDANDGYFDVSPIFHFDPSPEQVLKENGDIQYAVCRLNVKTLKQKPMPIFFRFYWLAASNKWLPIEHAMPSSKSKKHSYCF